MSNVIPFDFEGTSVRTLIRDGEPWFVLADVCRVLELDNPRNVTARLDDDEKGVHTMDTPGGPQSFTIINESGLYALILTSRKPSAKRFRKWVTAEVLPSIRKTGAYFVAQDTAPEPDEAPIADAGGVNQLPMRTAEFWLQMVREARLLSGPDAACALWATSPLPAIPYQPERARHSERHGETLALDPTAKTWPGTPEGRLMAVLSLKASGGGRTVAQMIEAGDCRSFLARNGVLIDPPGWPGFFAIANTGPATLLAWGHARGDGRRALMMLDGVRDGGKPFRFGRMSSRAVLVPLALLRRAPMAA